MLNIPNLDNWFLNHFFLVFNDAIPLARDFLVFGLLRTKFYVVWIFFIGCFLVGVIFFLTTQRYSAVHSHEALGGSKKSAHSWKSFTTSAQPHYCTSCRQLVFAFWMFRNTGWECTVCRRTAHTRCLGACNVLDCKCPSQSAPLRHQLVEGNLPSGSLCCVCGILCWSPFSLLGLRCLWCNRTLHEECLNHLDQVCDLGELQPLVLPPTVVRLSFFPTSYFALLRSFLSSTKHSPHYHPSRDAETLYPPVTLDEGNLLSNICTRLHPNSLWKKSLMTCIASKKCFPNEQSGREKTTQLFFSSSSSFSSSSIDVQDVGDGSFNSEHGVASLECQGRVDSLAQYGSGYLCNVPEESEKCTDVISKKTLKTSKSKVECKRSKTKMPDTKTQDFPKSFFKNRIDELAHLLPTKANVWEIDLKKFQDVSFVKDERDTSGGKQQVKLNNKCRDARPSHSIEDYNSCGRFSCLKEFPVSSLRQCRPLLVFVNAKSGGQAGSELFKELYRYLNPIQVVDVQLKAEPQRALKAFRGVAKSGCLRILVCGGDGTAGWVIDELQKIYGIHASCSVPVALLPLGTGNDLAHVLGWGQDFNGDLFEFLKKVQSAQVHPLDLWKIRVIPKGLRKPIIDTTFNNYVDLGIAAKIALKFHQLREAHPELFQSRLGNKFLYGEMGVREWVADKNRHLDDIKVWCDGIPVMLPSKTIQGLIIVNIPSFSGGINLWQTPPSSMDKADDEPPQDDYLRQRQKPGDSLLSSPPNSLKTSPPHRGLSNLSRRKEKPYYSFDQQHIYSHDLSALEKISSVTFSSTSSEVTNSFKDQKERNQPLSENVGTAASRQQFCHVVNESVISQASQSSCFYPNRDHHDPHDKENIASSFSCDTSPKDISQEISWAKETKVSLEHFAPTRKCNCFHKTPMYVISSPKNTLRDEHSMSQCLEDLSYTSPTQWKKQSINDGIIEVVAVRSLFHLGQIQVGMAEPLRVCQGHSIQVYVPAEVPLQINGEPKMVPACTIDISYRGASYVLSPRDANDHFVLETVTQILNSAVHTSLLTSTQRDILHQEFIKRL